MATAVMLDVNHEVPQADAHEEEPSREATQETTAQEMDNALPDASLNDCRVERVPLKDIYVEGGPQDDNLIKALADSIAHIGLQNPICVVKNDMLEHDTPYRIVSGRQRYKAYKSLGRESIPCHILTYEEEAFADERKRLAQYEENLLRKKLTVIETCTLLGKAKEAYLKMYPETGQGKAPKKHPGTGRLPYVLMASQMLRKSKSTVAKYLQIYEKVIVLYSEELSGAGARCPYLLESIEELSMLAQEKTKDIGEILKTMQEYGVGVGQASGIVQKQHVQQARQARQAPQRQARQAPLAAPSQTSGESPVPASPQCTPEDTRTLEDLFATATELTDELIQCVEARLCEQERFTFEVYREMIYASLEDIDTQPPYDWYRMTCDVRFLSLETPQDYTLPAECPGWGLYTSDQVCQSCPHKLECFKAQILPSA
jgi:hypothetical protein